MSDPDEGELLFPNVGHGEEDDSEGDGEERDDQDSHDGFGESTVNDGDDNDDHQDSTSHQELEGRPESLSSSSSSDSSENPQHPLSPEGFPSGVLTANIDQPRVASTVNSDLNDRDYDTSSQQEPEVGANSLPSDPSNSPVPQRHQSLAAFPSRNFSEASTNKPEASDTSASCDLNDGDHVTSSHQDKENRVGSVLSSDDPDNTRFPSFPYFSASALPSRTSTDTSQPELSANTNQPELPADINQPQPPANTSQSEMAQTSDTHESPLQGFVDFDHGKIEDVLCADYNKYGDKLVTGSADHQLRVLYDHGQDDLALVDTWRGHNGPVLDVSFCSLESH